MSAILVREARVEWLRAMPHAAKLGVKIGAEAGAACVGGVQGRNLVRAMSSSQGSNKDSVGAEGSRQMQSGVATYPRFGESHIHHVDTSGHSIFQPHQAIGHKHPKSQASGSFGQRAPWKPPSRWLPPFRNSLSDVDCQENRVDYRHCLKYDLGSWPREPLPGYLEEKLARRLSRLEFTPEMLTVIATRIGEIPKNRVDPAMHTGRRAAVMLPLCNVDGKPSVLLNLRSQNVGTHKGHVCFPGGHLDLTDECMETCANREVQEELGIRIVAPSDRRLWEVEWRKRPYYPESNILGRLPNCVALTGTLVTPVVGFMGEVDMQLLARTHNRDEIEEVFTMSIEELLNPANIQYDMLHMGENMPAFVSGKHRVWGLTAFMLHHFLMEVMLPSILTFRLSLDHSS